MLIGITGKAGSGKDTVAAGLAHDRKLVIYRMADPLKRGLEAMFGFGRYDWENRDWKDAPIEWLGRSPRYLAQTIGTEWARNLVHPDVWVLIADRKLDEVEKSGSFNGLVVPDIRFENEAIWIQERGGILLEVLRPELEEIGENGHSSEAGFDDGYISDVLINDGTIPELHKRAEAMVNDISRAGF